VRERDEAGREDRAAEREEKKSRGRRAQARNEVDDGREDERRERDVGQLDGERDGRVGERRVGARGELTVARGRALPRDDRGSRQEYDGAERGAREAEAERRARLDKGRRRAAHKEEADDDAEGGDR